MWFQILQMTNLVRILAPKFCDPFQSGCEMWAIATFSSRTVKDLSCHITEIQETLCWKIPPKCLISIVSPNLFFGILVGANHFHWNRQGLFLIMGMVCYWGQPRSAHCCSWRASWLGVHLIQCVNPGNLHVRFRTVPEKASMMPWRHDGVTLSHPAVQRNICFRWFWMLRRCTADPQLDSEVVHGTFSDRTKGYTGLVSPIVPDASQRGSRTVPQSTTWF